MAGQYFKHWRDVPDWLWPKNFHPKTDPMLASPGTGEIYFDIESFQSLQHLREAVGPISVLSGFRSKVHNARVGGSPRSYHYERIAYDIRIAPYSVYELVAKAKEAGFTGFGYYPTRGFIHVDRGRPRFWYGSQKDKQIMTQSIDMVL